jgi:heme A synthase
MSVVTIHGFVANAVNIFTLLVTLYAAMKYLQKNDLSSDFWGAVAIGEGLMVIQAVLGIIMLVEGLFPAQWVHILYGVVTALTWPATYTFTRDKQPPAREALIWMIVSAVLFGVTLRARATG